jgi:hypothetical protein
LYRYNLLILQAKFGEPRSKCGCDGAAFFPILLLPPGCGIDPVAIDRRALLSLGHIPRDGR